VKILISMVEPGSNYFWMNLSSRSRLELRSSSLIMEWLWIVPWNSNVMINSGFTFYPLTCVNLLHMALLL
jgi:hypothetical protein